MPRATFWRLKITFQILTALLREDDLKKNLVESIVQNKGLCHKVKGDNAK